MIKTYFSHSNDRKNSFLINSCCHLFEMTCVILSYVTGISKLVYPITLNSHTQNIICVSDYHTEALENYLKFYKYKIVLSYFRVTFSREILVRVHVTFAENFSILLFVIICVSCSFACT